MLEKRLQCVSIGRDDPSREVTSLLATCPRHGVFAATGFLGGTVTYYLKDVSVSCPVCRTPSPVADGSYDFVDSVVQAFRSDGVTRENIERFRQVATRVQAGNISRSEADEIIAGLGTSLSRIWAMINNNGSAIAVVLAIIALYISVQSNWSNDAAATKQAQSAATQIEVTQQIYNELRTMNLRRTERVNPREGTPVNRHERRRAEKLRKRGK